MTENKLRRTLLQDSATCYSTTCVPVKHKTEEAGSMFSEISQSHTLSEAFSEDPESDQEIMLTGSYLLLQSADSMLTLEPLTAIFADDFPDSNLSFDKDSPYVADFLHPLPFVGTFMFDFEGGRRVKNGRKPLRPRVRFPDQNVVSKVIMTPRWEDSEKENLFYTAEDMLRFREDYIYEREATIESKIVDYFENKFVGVLKMLNCGAPPS
mmetsp:Transcript_26816/g.38476  ORF Transcript_26816/g.38476 Transcript_26816/m.38476 type:complete len:210 (-) Transcript_26816:2870-3499(-)